MATCNVVPAGTTCGATTSTPNGGLSPGALAGSWDVVVGWAGGEAAVVVVVVEDVVVVGAVVVVVVEDVVVVVVVVVVVIVEACTV